MSARRPLLVLVPSGAGAIGGDGTMSQARTPRFDRVASRATLLTVRTTPDGLPPGTEVGLPTLLGVRVRVPPSRGYLDAAALGVEPLDGTSAWRVDLYDRGQPWVVDDPLNVAITLTQTIGAPVHHLRGHRFVLVGPRSWGDGPDRPRATRPALRRGRAWRRRLGGARDQLPGIQVTVWGRSNPVQWSPELPRRTVVVAVDGSPAVGVARAAGLDLRVVPRDTGHAIGELRALADAAGEVLADPDGPIVVVHTHHVDDAAHHGRRADKVALLSAVDLELTAPLLAAAHDVGAGLWWCPDHGTDARYGRHLPAPVPSLFTPDVSDRTVRHLHPVTERAMRWAPSADGRTLLASLVHLVERDAA